MQSSRSLLAFLALVGVGATASARLTSAACEPPTGAEPSSAPSPSAQPAALPPTFQSLAGEWEGQVEARDQGGRVSSSLAAASSRIEDNGRTLVMCIQGFAFGESLEGASIWRLNPATAQVEHAMYRSDAGLTIRCTGQPGESSGTIRISGPCADGAAAQESRLEQVVRTSGDSQFTMEWIRTDPAGTRSVVLRLDMNRLPKDRKSDAFALLDNQSLLRHVREPSPQTASATR
jgi:hypothetical protein